MCTDDEGCPAPWRAGKETWVLTRFFVIVRDRDSDTEGTLPRALGAAGHLADDVARTATTRAPRAAAARHQGSAQSTLASLR